MSRFFAVHDFSPSRFFLVYQPNFRPLGRAVFGLARGSQFTPLGANARGPGIGYATHRAPGGEQSTYPIWQCNEADCETQPIAVSPEFTTELILYGSGFGVTQAGDAATEPARPRDMQAIIGGVTVPILSVAPIEGLPGASQLQLRLDQQLQRTGETDLRLIVDGQTANIVRIRVE